jgi:hypothetical protein
MKVLNLRCDAGHGFEGWFASENDYQSQTERGLLSCPLCGAAGVVRLPSAPRLNLSGAQAPRDVPAAVPAAQAPSPARAGGVAPVPAQRASVTPHPAAEALWLAAVQQVMANTEDVGAQFAEEARRIHYGEAEERGIRGQTTPEQAQALHEEGIEVVSLPVPPGLKGPAH